MRDADDGARAGAPAGAGTGWTTTAPEYARLGWAMAAAGVATFALLYAPQPLLPVLAHAFAVSPAGASLLLAAGTAGLGGSVVVAGSLAERLGRRPVMVGALWLAAALGLASALAPTYAALLALRALQGMALAGVPAAATAHIAAEVHPGAVGRGVGRYIGGTALGGMCGRLLAGGVADRLGWRAGLGADGVLALIAAAGFVLLLPPERHRPRPPLPPSWRRLAHNLLRHLGDPLLDWLFAVAGLLMGAFVGLFNAVAFRLEAPPYDLSAGVAALVFLVYLAGSAASDAAGRLADRLGRRPVVTAGALVMAAGIGLTAAAPLPLVVAGLTVATAGFFAAHAVASAWVPARARIGPAQAASLYLFAYYAGSSLFGPLASLTWSRGRWPAVSALLLALVLAAAALALVAGRHRDAADAPSASAAGPARR